MSRACVDTVARAPSVDDGCREIRALGRDATEDVGEPVAALASTISSSLPRSRRLRRSRAGLHRPSLRSRSCRAQPGIAQYRPLPRCSAALQRKAPAKTTLPTRQSAKIMGTSPSRAQARQPPIVRRSLRDAAGSAIARLRPTAAMDRRATADHRTTQLHGRLAGERSVAIRTQRDQQIDQQFPGCVRNVRASPTHSSESMDRASRREPAISPLDAPSSIH